MASQKMRLEAEMKDNASPAIKALRAELSALQATSADTRGSAKLNDEINKLASGAAVDGSAAVRRLRAELADLQKATAENRAISGLNKEIAALKKGSGEVAPTAGMKAFNSWMGEAKTAATGVMGAVGGFAEVLGPIGIGAVGAGAAVSSLASEMKRLGEQSLAMKELSRQTGMSVDFVNRWSHAGEHFGVAGDAMRGMLDRFAGQIPDFNRGVGSMFKEFSIWPDVVRKMQSEAPADALMDAFRQIEEVGRVRGPEVQKQVLESMGLGPEAEKLFMERLAGFQKQLDKPWNAPSQDLMTQAQALRDAGIDLNNDFEHLENIVGPGFLKGLKGGVDAVDKVVKFWVWEFQKIADLFDYIGKSSKDGAKAFEDGEKRAIPAPLNPNGPALNLPEEKRRRIDGQEFGHIGKKASYDGTGFGSLRQNASFETGADPTSSSQFGLSGIIADGTKAGVLAAFRDWSVQSGADKPGSRGGFTNASYADGGGGAGGGGGGVGGRRGHGAAPSNDGGAGEKPVGRKGFMLHGHGGGSGDGTPAAVWSGDGKDLSARANLNTKDVRNKNPMSVGWANWEKEFGGTASRDTDTGHNMASFPSWTAGYKANQALMLRKYAQQGLHSIRQIIATPNTGWTPGNMAAVDNIAKAMGISPDADLKLNTPEGLSRFSYALMNQEMGRAEADYARKQLRQEQAAGAQAENGTKIVGGANLMSGGHYPGARPGADLTTITTADGRRLTVHKDAAPSFKRFLDQLEGRGYKIDDLGGFGGLNRANKSNPRRLSEHAYGNAIDINPAKNPFHSDRTDMPADISKLAAENGLSWGGDWSPGSKDPMHFEWRGVRPWMKKGSDGTPVGSKPTKEDLNRANENAYRSPQNPFLGRRATDVAPVPNPNAGRRANGLGDAPRERQDGSEHRLTIALHDPGGHVKSTRIERNGPLKVEMPNRWQTGRNPLIGA